MINNRSAYEILEIAQDATTRDIKLRYKALVREFSPEHNPDKFMEIRAAYDELMSTDMKAYDYFPVYKKPLEFLTQEEEGTSNTTISKKPFLGILFETPYDTKQELKQLIIQNREQRTKNRD